MNVPNEQHRNIITKIGNKEGFEVHHISSLAGGSINEVFLLKTSSGEKVLKLNEASLFPRMFEAEKTGLETLAQTKTIDVPKVYSCGELIADSSYLLLEYKAEGEKQMGFWELFSEELAALHRVSHSSFGFHSSNYIGSLTQKNGRWDTASDFYINERLRPQLGLAAEKAYIFQNLDPALENISELIPEEPPALIHGDLWSGNYLVNKNGHPCLIDPAVCYAPREMDLAMMKLFGGFPDEVFFQYSENFPLQPGFGERIPFWQLYYLLVHLNIFGSSYYPSVKNILEKYA